MTWNAHAEPFGTLDNVLTALAVIGLIVWLGAVLQCGRAKWRQVHHGWLLVLAVPAEVPVWLRCLALVVGFDDVAQHLVQCWKPDYLSPVHKLGHVLGLY